MKARNAMETTGQNTPMAQVQAFNRVRVGRTQTRVGRTQIYVGWTQIRVGKTQSQVADGHKYFQRPEKK